MITSLPADLLKLKAQFDSWRKTRTKKGPIPLHLRIAARSLLDRYSQSMICRALSLHPRSLQSPPLSKAPLKATTNKSPDFFSLPTPLPHPDFFSAIGSPPADCRLLLEGTDGSRLTILLPTIDADLLSALFSNFLHCSRP